MRTFARISMNIFGALMAATVLPPASAADTMDAGEPKRCVSLMQIRNIDIVDNRNIVFHMTGDVNYLNELPYACPGLRKGTPIMYRTSQSELCNVDVITVLDYVGSEFRPGASCGLGMYRSVTDDEIKTLKDKIKSDK